MAESFPLPPFSIAFRWLYPVKRRGEKKFSFFRPNISSLDLADKVKERTRKGDVRAQRVWQKNGFRRVG